MRSFRTATLLALPLVALTMAVPAHADVKAGVDAWQSGNYQAAVAEWRPLALAGDPDAQFNLGQAYKLGRGVPTDLAQAETWYRRAAKQGHLQAQDNLGLILFTANRREEAMEYIVRSAERGEPRAQYVLGTAHFNGDLAAQDWPRAYALTKRASDAGLEIASARLVQLDGLIPLEQRQRGLALLPQMEKDEARARLAAVNAAAPPPAAASPSSTIKSASLPASTPGTSYAPPPVIAPAAPTSPVAATAAKAAADAAAAAAVASKPGTSYAPPPLRGPLPPVQDSVAVPAAKAAPATAKPAPAPVRAVAAGPWRAQLGAFGVEGNARNLWKSLERKYAIVAGREPLLVKSGKLTRLQAGGFASRKEADGFCSTLRKGGQACLVMDK
ncbi:MAG: SPOR domain-containing protein [Sphingopyxis sp.]|uniref:SPOR domain-containing protein n=1 Tax=Sphingopyxis sp. TaxID=1908224 RepID=UPI002ABC647D|nr:SPOR domain-containing protein [Sphingopyxis sp.]MDZ3833767.1 SPOR domain-containing protein [Sphingopyxis sp.]